MEEHLTISPEEVDAIMSMPGFPETFTGKAHRRLPVEQLVEEIGSLDATHIEAVERQTELGLTSGLPFNQTVKALRHTHHRLAQFLAGGMDETIAAKLCNYHPLRVSHLKADPAFQELLTHYTNVVDDEFADFHTAAAALSIDMLGALQAMLDEAPEKFGPGHLMDAIKLLADRTGHAPVSKSVNINVNTDMAQRLREAQARRARAQAALPSPEDGT